MSDSIDLKRLHTTYAEGRQLHELPSVWLFENFATQEEMPALREAAGEQLRPAQVSGDRDGYISPGRTRSNCWVRHDHCALTLSLASRIADLVGIPLENAESYQVVYYGPGQEYRAHVDAWDADTGRGQRCMARGGQRLVTTLLYLNHVEAGGATGFPKLELDVHPLPGNLLLLPHRYPGTARRHELSLHGGLPVTAGEKWAANLWFRERTYQRR